MKSYVLKSTGERVTSKDGEWPKQYANRTQAQKAAAQIPNADVIQRGRPFYVRLKPYTQNDWGWAVPDTYIALAEERRQHVMDSKT